MDMLSAIYNAMIGDDFIQKNAYGRIKYYEYPPTDNLTAPHIVIDPLDTPTPSDYADDTWLTNDYLFQIEVWSNNRLLTKELAERIRNVMWEMGFRQTSGIDEWDKDYKIYRDARRYTGKAYRQDLDSL